MLQIKIIPSLIVLLIFVNVAWAETLVDKEKSHKELTFVERTAMFMAEIKYCEDKVPVFKIQASKLITQFKSQPFYKEIERSPDFNNLLATDALYFVQYQRSVNNNVEKLCKNTFDQLQIGFGKDQGPPTYYRRTEPVTAQLLFPICNEPAEAKIMEQCSLITSRIDFLESKLKVLCSNAGETILRTADNVQGVYEHVTQQIGFGYFHEDDRIWGSYMNPRLGRHYTLWEMDMFWKKSAIANRRYEILLQEKGRAKINEPYKEVTDPESTYGITWQPLTSISDQRLESIYGDELTIFQIKTKETMATRRFYYYVIGENDMALGAGRYIRPPGYRSFSGNFIRACPNYSPKEYDGYIDHRPRDSYEFVSKVLRPKPLEDRVASGVFDLTRNSGHLTSDCIFVSFGPRIRPSDFSINKERDDLIFKIQGTDDLTCSP